MNIICRNIRIFDNSTKLMLNEFRFALEKYEKIIERRINNLQEVLFPT